jgi:hypothetical protein
LLTDSDTNGSWLIQPLASRWVDGAGVLVSVDGSGPSAILVREIIDLRPQELAVMIISTIDLVEEDLF